MSSVNPAFPNKSPSPAKSPVPPDEQFWQRYSPHYEFPLSSITSFALHVVALTLVFFLGKYLLDKLSKPNAPLNEIGVVVEGGGGGNPEGVGPGPGGELKDQPPPEEVGDTKPREPSPIPDPKRANLDAPVPPLLALPDTKDESARELIQRAGDAVRAQAKMSKEINDKLRHSIGYGQDGPGSGGGKDRGTDTGTGRKTGPGTGNERWERTLRWVMVFDTFSGHDYANQLAGLGAILAIPRGKNQYEVYRNVGVKWIGDPDLDVERIKRIYWVDDKRESITPLCNALGIKFVPDHVVAFFPEELEKKLLKLELNFWNKKEEEIFETRFKVLKSGGGYEPRVVKQTDKNGNEKTASR